MPTQTKRRKRLLLGMMGVFVLLLGGVVGVWYFTLPAPEPVGILQGSGRVEGTEITITAKVGGRIKAIYASEGEYVQAGTLATISSEQLEAQSAQAASQVALAEAQVEEVRTRLVELKQVAQQNQTALILAEQQSQHQIHQAKAAVETARANIQLAEAELTKAHDDYARFQQLAAKGVISQEQRQTAETAFQAAKARLEAATKQHEEARAALQMAQTTTYTTALRRQEHARALAQLEQGRATLRSAEQRVILARAAQQEVEATLADTRILAPASGTVLSRLAEPGEVVTAGRPLLVLVDLSQLFLRVYIPEKEIGKIILGNPARITVDAFPNRFFAGQVSEIAQQAEFTPRDIHTPDERTTLVFGVKIALEESQGVLKPGMPADALIRWQEGVPWPDRVVRAESDKP